MNSIRYLSQHNPHPGTPNDADNRRLCWQARHAETEGERLAARNELILRNQPLIAIQAKIVRRVSRLPLDDLVSEGQIGLILAIGLFDFERREKFSTYASACIFRHMQRVSWTHGGEITLPAYLIEAKKRKRYIAEAKQARRTLSLATPVSSRRILADELPDHHAEAGQDATAVRERLIATLIGKLPERQCKIVSLCFGLDGGRGRTNKEVGVHFGLTGERISQLKAKAVATMAEVLEKEMAG